MASEHVLEIKARLDDSDVKRKMEQLNNSQQARDVGSSSSQVSQGLQQLSLSMKQLKNAIGGGLVAQSFNSLARSMNMFGDEMNSLLQQMQGGFNRIAAAAGTGNYALVGLVSALEALNMAVNANDTIDKLVSSKVKGRYVNKSDWEANDSATFKYAREREIDAALKSRDANSLESLLGRMLDEQSWAAERVRDMQENGAKKGDFAQALAELKEVDAVVERIRDALKSLAEEERKKLEKEKEAVQKAVDAANKAVQDAMARAAKERETRMRELGEAKSQWRFGQDFANAVEGKDSSWLEDAMNKAMEGMTGATTAQEFNRQSSIFEQARSALERMEEETRGGYMNQLQQLLGGYGGNSFQSAGFGMGETNPTQNLENQIDQIIRLMEESMQRQMQYKNVNVTL